MFLEDIIPHSITRISLFWDIERVINLLTIYCSANMHLGNIKIYACMLMNFISLQRSQLLVLTTTAITR